MSEDAKSSGEFKPTEESKRDDAKEASAILLPENEVLAKNIPGSGRGDNTRSLSDKLAKLLILWDLNL